MFKLILISFLLSFCSLVYELIFSKTFVLITSNMVLAQTVPIGVYLLGIGLGSVYQKNSSFEERPFVFIELGLCALALTLSFFSYFIDLLISVFLTAYFENLFPIKLALFLLMPVSLGFLTGREFMLLIKKGKTEGVSINIILAATYFGNLFAGALFPLFVYKPLGLVGSCALVASLNLIVACYFALKVPGKVLKSLLFIGAMASSAMAVNADEIERKLKSYSYLDIATTDFGLMHIKNLYVYFKNRAPRVESYRSRYQEIDIVNYKNEGTSLFLNRKPQFSSKTYESYHISMVEGYVNLSGSVPEEVLLLGGGDGIIARYLLERGVKSIRIIDLDPFMTYLASSHPAFLSLNKGALLNERVEVTNGDAFSFLLKNKKKYEAVFIDFPFPTHLDLSKLYSVEFYRKVRESLTDSGSAILDVPVDVEFDFSNPSLKSLPLDLIYGTLREAGVSKPFGFGPFEGFVYFKKKNKKAEFDYESLPLSLPGFVFMNLVGLDSFLDEAGASKFNSIFRPRRHN